jgi:hypothetical protein
MMTKYKTLRACVAFMLMGSFCTSVARADTMTLLILIQLEKSVPDEAVLGKLRSISLGNCLVGNAVSLGSDQIIARIQCDDLLKDAGSKALADIVRLENIKQATTFSVSRP